jgi:hypothetical protein
MSRTKSWIAALVMVAGVTPSALAFESGSTGTDGAFQPTVNTDLQLPPSGIFNFTTVTIPAGVRVKLKRNTTNTPVVILASGNVTVAGIIDLNGTLSTNAGANGDGNLGDDGIPGTGGAGGYDGGSGGARQRPGGPGHGPGGGGGGSFHTHNTGPQIPAGGAGAGFGTAGVNTFAGGGGWTPSTPTGIGGGVYGSSVLLPLIGGSGGGGGAGGGDFKGSGGGGGGGAILIASSGTINITGSILANGATSGGSGGPSCGGTGGSGSGGAIRLVATTVSGNGPLSAQGTNSPNPGPPCNAERGGASGIGRIRIEAENITRTAASDPPHTFGAPGPVFIAGLPTLRITSVAGVAAPVEPTGTADITLPATTANPVTVEFATTGVPVGNTVRLTVKPANAAPISAVSPALTGTTENATASVGVSLPSGPSTLEATTTYTIVAALGEDLGLRFAQGERVERIELTASLQGESAITLITVTGKRYTVSRAEVPAMIVG